MKKGGKSMGHDLCKQTRFSWKTAVYCRKESLTFDTIFSLFRYIFRLLILLVWVVTFLKGCHKAADNPEIHGFTSYACMHACMYFHNSWKSGLPAAHTSTISTRCFYTSTLIQIHQNTFHSSTPHYALALLHFSVKIVSMPLSPWIPFHATTSIHDIPTAAAVDKDIPSLHHCPWRDEPAISQFSYSLIWSLIDGYLLTTFFSEHQ